jgi:ribosome biogenesis GTPase A
MGPTDESKEPSVRPIPAVNAVSMDDSPVNKLISVAREAGAAKIVDDALLLRERIREGLFYVACVGQFKRGKSTLLNALIGKPLLPVGVPP